MASQENFHFRLGHSMPGKTISLIFIPHYYIDLSRARDDFPTDVNNHSHRSYRPPRPTRFQEKVEKASAAHSRSVHCTTQSHPSRLSVHRISLAFMRYLML